MSLGIRFTETMRGHVSTTVLDDYRRAEEDGKRTQTPLEFTVTVSSNDLDRMLIDAAHDAELTGTIRCPALWPEPLTVTNGGFNLLTRDPGHVNARQMRYRMSGTSAGRSFPRRRLQDHSRRQPPGDLG